MGARSLASESLMSEPPHVFNASLGVEDSYYVATANQFTPAPALHGNVAADVCVVGGGSTGLAAALFLIQHGFSVVVLEGGRIGWGASGRSGGQIIPGLRKGAADLVKSYGLERAKAIFAIAIEARDLVVDLIQKHQIACDLSLTGHILSAAKEADLIWMAAEVAALREVMDYPYVSMLSQHAVRTQTPMAKTFGGILDTQGGHLHPLNYALGLADAVRQKGGRLFEHSRVLKIDREGGFVAHTEHGSVSARFGVLAGDCFLGGVEPRLSASIMPVASYVGATAPLENPHAIIANNQAISDSRFAVNYFRLSSDGRLLFGGGERYTPEPPQDMRLFVREQMTRVFPQLAHVDIDHAWGGLVSVTTSRLPHVGKLGSAYFAHGFSGQGVIMTTLVGKLIAEAVAGQGKGFDVFAGLKPRPFPGGPALRTPLYVAGMLYYALRDRL